MPALGDPWDTLTIVDKEAATPVPGTLCIRVEATDLNFADILQCQGSYQVKLQPPFTPGMNAAGIVMAVGDDVAVEIGRRVVGPTLAPSGGFAEQAILLAEHAQPIPDGVSSIVAMGMHVTYATAWFALHHRGRLKPGETVLVLAAAGGVGSAAVQMARQHGCWVMAAAGGEEKVRVCGELGADLVIDYDAEDLYASVMDATDGRGVDVVYDPVGGKYFDAARRLVAWEGRLLVVGFASGTIPSAPANHVLVKNYAVVGTHMGGYRDRHPDIVRRCYEDLHQQLLDEKISPFVSEVIGFDALPDALRRLADRRTVGRVVFDPSFVRRAQS
ncbi:MAG: NADPH:quinone oxidoreductase family protein [Gammaproteobacteria bacterium]|nr:NADPH:quinone oxidoreductase family protein [Gammaproteobacteria bacterium]